MASIFDRSDNTILQQRVQNLTSASQPLWGKMSVSQMVKHCQKPLEVAEGNLIMKRNLFGILFGKMAKRSFIEKEISKNIPTPREFKITSDPDFDTEINVLLAAIIRFGNIGPAVIHNHKHPFFGNMTDDEWGILQYKHLDHHLRQFNV